MTDRQRLALLGVMLSLLLSFLGARSYPAVALARVTRDETTVTLANDYLSVRYDVRHGTANYAWGGRTLIANGYSGVVLADQPGRVDYYSFDVGERAADVRPFSDAIGRGLMLQVTTSSAALDVTLIQQIYVYDDAPFLTQRAGLMRRSAGGPPVSTGQIEVVAASLATDPPGGAALPSEGDVRFYLAPYYNSDDYAALPVAQARGVLSYWLGGLVDADGGPGLILGAVESDRWKSAVWYDGPSGSISAHSGTQAPVDAASQGPITAPRVDSALTFVGYRDDWQDAMADLMGAVRAVAPPLGPVALPAPVGWSAWYDHGVLTDERVVRGVTDFIAANWSALGYRYINLDAGWNRADGDTRADPVKFPNGIESLVKYIHDRGLLAGGYFIPFAVSPTLLDQQAPGTPFRYRDMLLRDGAGQPVHASILNWEYVLDATHPGAEAYLTTLAQQLVDDGFDFIKIDFLQVGTQEGVHYDANATAMEAFQRGMAAITRVWQGAGRPIFISAAISPLYVQQYAHARRVGNDVEFGQVREAKNVALSWFTGLLYTRNDPDNAVVRGTWFPGYNDNLAKLHATVSALGGTLFIAGDDPRQLSPQRAALLTNPWVLSLTRQPLVARPLSLGATPPPVWYADGPDGTHVVAIFNWDGARGARQTIRFRDLGLPDRGVYRLFDLWENAEMGTHEHDFTVDVPPQGVLLLFIVRVS